MSRFGRWGWIASLALVSACQGEATAPIIRAEEASELPADQIAWDVEHTMTSNGVRKALLHSDTIFYRQAAAPIDLRGVDLTFFDATGAPSGRLTSETGEYDWRAGSMIARGNAVLVLQGQGGKRTIETEELHFDLEEDRVWSDQPTVMREGSQVVRGASFESDTRFDNVTVQQARTEGGPPPPAAADGSGVSF